jgi:hypothetical protein
MLGPLRKILRLLPMVAMCSHSYAMDSVRSKLGAVIPESFIAKSNGNDVNIFGEPKGSRLSDGTHVHEDYDGTGLINLTGWSLRDLWLEAPATDKPILISIFAASRDTAVIDPLVHIEVDTTGKVRLFGSEVAREPDELAQSLPRQSAGSAGDLDLQPPAATLAQSDASGGDQVPKENVGASALAPQALSSQAPTLAEVKQVPPPWPRLQREQQPTEATAMAGSADRTTGQELSSRDAVSGQDRQAPSSEVVSNMYGAAQQSVSPSLGPSRPVSGSIASAEPDSRRKEMTAARSIPDLVPSSPTSDEERGSTAKGLTNKAEIAPAYPLEKRPQAADQGRPTAAGEGGANRPAVPSQEVALLLERAERLLQQGDVSGARLMLDRAAGAGSGRAMYLLAQTFDPRLLRAWNVRGMKGDPGMARDLYARAERAGYSAAR